MRWLFSIGTLLCLGQFVSSAEAAEKPSSSTRPNILLMIADNWCMEHTGVNGDRVVQTPAFDRLAREGANFKHAFCLVPSCAPARAALLTGQAVHRLGGGASNWGPLPRRYAVYPEILARHGYKSGHAGKGWDPASLKESERSENPAGPKFASFAEFLEEKPADQPFCFWFGSKHPHRRWNMNQEAVPRMNPADIRVPGYLPDTPEVRGDILNYYAEVQAFDREVAGALALLEEKHLAENTLVIVTGDNGWQMPHGLGHVYDAGTHVPLAIRWPAQIKSGKVIEDFVNFDDIAPTLLDAAGVDVPADMTGGSLLPLLKGEATEPRTFVCLERERHAYVRPENLGYPVRAIRTRDYFYVRNFEPERWPAGDPELIWSVGPYGDVDNSVTKDLILNHQSSPQMHKFYTYNFAHRPAEELYDLKNDPDQTVNLAGSEKYAEIKHRLRRQLEQWMVKTDDPRAKNPHDDRWDREPYFGGKAKTEE